MFRCLKCCLEFNRSFLRTYADRRGRVGSRVGHQCHCSRSSQEGERMMPVFSTMLIGSDRTGMDNDSLGHGWEVPGRKKEIWKFKVVLQELGINYMLLVESWSDVQLSKS